MEREERGEERTHAPLPSILNPTLSHHPSILSSLTRTTTAPPLLPRRAALLAAALAAVSTALGTPAADAATAAPSTPSFLPDLLPAPLPARYVTLTRRLVSDLRTAITTEVAGAEEFEVRRAAEPAKEAVKEWVGSYGRAASSASPSSSSSSVAAVEGTPSHPAVQAALKTLGAFYGAKGQRARLDGATAEAVLAALAAAEDGLPPPAEEKSLKERLFGEK